MISENAMSALKELFAHTTDAIFGIDENRNIRFWNKSCENLLGLSHQQAIGRSCADLLCGRDLQGNKICETECPIAKASNAQAPYVQTPNSEFDLVLKNRESKPIEVNVESYYIGKPYQKNNNYIQVFHSIRPANRDQLNQKRSNDSLIAE